MRLIACNAALALAILAPATSLAGDRTKSALETSPKGWIDVMPSKDFTNWRRVPLPPDVKLNERNPWRLSADGKTLICDGVGIKEMFLHNDEQGDGRRAEWDVHGVLLVFRRTGFIAASCRRASRPSRAASIRGRGPHCSCA